MARLTLSALRKSYGAHAVVHGVDLDVADREFIVLVGPSGCGKSTILRMIAGLEEITSGSIAIDGRVVNEVDPKDRDIAMVFQDYALYPHMTVEQNMAFSLRYRGFAKAEIRQRVAAAARMLDIETLVARLPRQLSGGQRQRVAMGRAIVRDPKVFLFDEPLSNLDAKLRVAMRTEIKALRQRVPVTTVYVTHDQVEAMTLADRIVVLDKGTAQQIGTPEEVYETPASTFVAAFMGAPPMNLLPASLSGEGAVELPGGTRLQLSGASSSRLDRAPSREIWFGVRPEHLVPARDTSKAEIVAKARVVEPLGSDTMVQFDLGGVALIARMPPKSVRAPGDPLAFTMDPHDVHVFDRASGRRI
ncbi:MAG: sn-glycerol-3-phosphate ABC transporter ATP-binding protein UgpC [Hyphomicrobiales bacterium]|nr:sn-glycerol-3-phosphate ABC transporter ATP-binding protein UgpC [Hyphomicrobiales bacterium]MBV9052376.1 sn-glycerol-3-phosphate ABC transporter ATP-binding protein UgpC [Hyphomicrobiales bacterium]MBV9974765.1 sn-glycerol-3-phosphate ABC transporter ATP-binding protein UgpC [Hyphomicrobiales bacterium]